MFRNISKIGGKASIFDRKVRCKMCGMPGLTNTPGTSISVAVYILFG